MAKTDIGTAEKSALSTELKPYEVMTALPQGAEDQDETTYYQTNFSKYFGYYKKIPEVHIVVNTIATWTVGHGFTAPIPEITMELAKLRGWGKDTFNTIIENMIRTYLIGGDAFAEIIRDEDDSIINLKPLDPSSIVIVANKKGMIKRYEQTSKTGGKTIKFQPEEIFHLCRNRVADEIHGTSFIEVLQDVILKRNEAMTDYADVLHRNIGIVNVFEVDTDDQTKIREFKALADKAISGRENIYIPKGNVSFQRISTPGFASMNPQPWIELLNTYFFQESGVAQIVLGSAKDFTDASAKIAFMAFEQRISEEQLFLEDQLLSQLGFIVKFNLPVSVQRDVLSQQMRQPSMEAKPSEITIGRRGL